MGPRQSYQDVASATRRVRPLDPADIPDILSIELTGYSHPWSEALFRDCFRPDYRLWGLADEDTLQGYAVVAYLFDEAHLLNLCVGSQWRGSGAGRLLLRHLIGESFREKMCRVLLEVRRSNDVAIGLYKTEGFVQIGERPGYYPASPAREDALVLALEGPGAG
ncbi:ribosomal-protein-alanine N-acetyltransferase [Marinobacter sp. R17]|uniref:ribosomal protein S18-alanine N-acetyltransferase n=1 Tax=Marinobacter TaxID=2742 RepID=UPI000F4C5948|nr:MULTISPECIES: ribosomal protein S18-alanine N-acetyltransferase [Marinobacter]ROT93552.1 ribosomal-protein-alanine N-acetyltransferase [Marinobacter sp. R17]